MYVFDLMVTCPFCSQEFYDSTDEVMQAGLPGIPVPGTCFSMRNKTVPCTKCRKEFRLSQSARLEITSQRVR